MIWLLIFLAASAQALESNAPVCINELSFSGSLNYTTDDQFVELYNYGDETVYLDGAMIGRGQDTLLTRAFKFPGQPGETNHPLGAGEFLLIAQDAFDFMGEGGDPTSVDLSQAPYETFSEFEWPTIDNPESVNLTDTLEIGVDFEMDRFSGAILLMTGIGFEIRDCGSS